MAIVFDGATSTVHVSGDQRTVDVQRDLYSRSVDWVRDNSMFVPPFEAEGGGYLIDHSPAPMIFRFKGKWKLKQELLKGTTVQILRFHNGYLALQSDTDPQRIAGSERQFYQNIVHFDQKFPDIASHLQLTKDLLPMARKCHTATMKLGLVYFDIDKFKELNTRLTETVVDKQILPPFIELLSSLINDKGFLFREGGDEFVCLAPVLTLAELRDFAEELRSSVEKAEFYGQKITISLGISMTRDAEDEDILERANKAKAEAKDSGRNRVAELA